jgi:hypothetical protein
MSAGVGMNKPASCVHQEHARYQTIERVGERSRFDLVKVDDLADRNGAPKMRGEQSHAPARSVIDKTVTLMSRDCKEGVACR